MAGEFLPTAALTESGRPIFLSGEIECSLLSSVDLLSEDLPSFPNFKSILITLTTHRIIIIQSTSSSSHFIPLASIQHINSTRKSLKSMFHSPRIRFQVSTSAEGRVVESGGTKSVSITLVLRGKSSDPDSFLGKFWDVWRKRGWEEGSGSGSGLGEGGGSGEGEGGSLAVRMPVVGLAGILRKEQEMWESTDKSLQDAFQDLNALMVRKCVLRESLTAAILLNSINIRA